MVRRFVLFLMLAVSLWQPAFAQPSPGSDTVWKKEIWPDYARSAFFSKDDSKLYVNTDRAVLIYEPLSGSLIREVEGKGFFLFESPDGMFIYTDSLLKLDAQTYEAVDSFEKPEIGYELKSLSMSVDGTIIMGAFFKPFLKDQDSKQNNNVIFYETQNLQITGFATYKESIWRGYISPNKNYYALATNLYDGKNDDRKVVLFDFNTKQPIDTLQEHLEPDINDIGWSPDSKYLAVLTELEVKLYKFPEMEFYGEFPHFPNDYTNVLTFAFDATSKYLITGGGYDYESQRLHVWDLESKNNKYKYPYFELYASGFCAFSNSNEWIITGIEHWIMQYNTECLRVGVVEMEQHLSGIIYPNPVNSSAVLTFNVQVPREYDIKLYNSTGLFIQQIFNGFLVNGANTINIDCSTLPQGVYYISFNNNEFYKLIKEN
jgi:WD40 repeat protein